MTEDRCQYNARDCHNCSRPVQGQVCTMSARDIDTCLGSPSRPFWKPKPERSCDNCNQRISAPDLKCPFPTETQAECAHDNFNLWEPIRNYESSGQETDYRPGSTVSKQADRIKELVDAHWSYQEKLLSAGQDKKQTFTWDQVMEMRKWDYTSSAKHFYGHGFEDAQEIKDAVEGRR